MAALLTIGEFSRILDHLDTLETQLIRTQRSIDGRGALRRSGSARLSGNEARSDDAPRSATHDDPAEFRFEVCWPVVSNVGEDAR